MTLKQAFVFTFLMVVQVVEETASSPLPTGIAASESRERSSAGRAEECTSEEGPLAGRAVYQAGEGDADSDDEVELAGPAQPEPLSASGDSVFADDSALNEEVERLMMALQGTSPATTSTPATWCGSSLFHDRLTSFIHWM
jgi:hypothetical protein